MSLRKIEGLHGGLTMVLSGYIDIGNVLFFRGKIREAVDAGYTMLAFDCAALNYVSSAGVGLFDSLLNAIKNKGGNAAFAAIQPKVLEVLEMIGFPHLSHIKESIEEAEAYLRSGDKREN